jgi:hypothetical protein
MPYAADDMRAKLAQSAATTPEKFLAAEYVEFHVFPRTYDLAAAPLPKPPIRRFRCTTFMVNFVDPIQGPRPATDRSGGSGSRFASGM